MTTLNTPSGLVPFEFVECHSLGHQWKHRGTIGIDDPDDSIRRPFGGSFGMIGYRSVCQNCKTERVKWLTRSGEVLNRYEYPDGYSKRGDQRLAPSEWRHSFAVSLFESFEHSTSGNGRGS